MDTKKVSDAVGGFVLASEKAISSSARLLKVEMVVVVLGKTSVTLI
jgi:hypothetical protein